MRVHLRQKYPLLSSKFVNWPSWITKFRPNAQEKQNGLIPRGEHDGSVWSMTVSASDSKSEVKLDEKRQKSVHKRKMLWFGGVNSF